MDLEETTDPETEMMKEKEVKEVDSEVDPEEPEEVSEDQEVDPEDQEVASEETTDTKRSLVLCTTLIHTVCTFA